jgi:hypothetical protein
MRMRPSDIVGPFPVSVAGKRSVCFFWRAWQQSPVEARAFVGVSGTIASRARELWPPTAEGMGNRQHDELGERHPFYQQEGAIRAEDAQRAFRFAPPIEWQETCSFPYQPQVLICGRGQKRGIPQPQDDDEDERANERGRLKEAAPDPGRNDNRPTPHAW